MQKKSTLHIFNPSHDEALASASPYYYPSTVARRLSAEWALMPLMWANENDYILCPNEAVFNNEMALLAREKKVEIVRCNDLKSSVWDNVTRVRPWGWDALVKQQLEKWGAPPRLLPSDEELNNIRMLSSRYTTAEVLPQLVQRLADSGIPTIGRSFVVKEFKEIELLIDEYENIVVKSLWSCSGRGVFIIKNRPTISDVGRINNLLRTQGALEVEPYYECMTDIALEFDAMSDGGVTYRGLSLFLTSPRGGYKANIIAPQDELQSSLFKLFPTIKHHFSTLIAVCEEVLSSVTKQTYEGPLGIDMMVVKDDNGSLLLHPCIEVNVRCTMGYVACIMATRNINHWPKEYPFCKM